MDVEQRKRMSLWLALNYCKGDPREYYDALCKYSEGIFAEIFSRAYRELHGGEAGDEKLVAEIAERIEYAEKQFAIWDARPSDTNARFFYAKLKNIDWNL